MSAFSIYRITNTANSKVYIGKTEQPPLRRWQRHQSSVRAGKLDTYLYRAMRKYGIENFKFEVIFSTDRKDDLDNLEREFIKAHDCCALDGKSKGYNMTRGGDGQTTESAKVINLKSAKTRRENGNYQTGSTHPRARKMVAVNPYGVCFELHGNLKAFCQEMDLSWQFLYNNIDTGPVDTTKVKNFARLTNRFWNTVGWQLWSIES